MNRRFPLCVLLIVLVSLINSLLAAARKIFSSAYVYFRDNVITVKPWYPGYAAPPKPSCEGNKTPNGSGIVSDRLRARTTCPYVFAATRNGVTL